MNMDLSLQLGGIVLFHGVSPEKIKTLAAQATFKKFKPGELVIGEADSIRSFYVVLTGQLKLYRSSAEGKEQTLQLLGPGDPFGLCTAFATDPFPASAMAIMESSVMLIPGTVMETMARQEPAILFNIIQILSQRLKDSMALIEALVLKELPGRLASFLMHDLAGNRSDQNTVALTISQRELAKILGATPEALSRTLRKMANDGILSTSGRTVAILDRKALAQLAEGE
ncbi:MAG: Crp/Fnr family transcriptional regulator [Deltaproteobacteria bacterium]|nr:MAG: Crp/Fnr family transcriptional regulator [Deltaproteobacteria bacterium]